MMAYDFWQLVETLSNVFYDPVVFWGLPFALALLWEVRRSK